MTFKEALEILGIEEHGEAIFKADPRGDLYYILDYIEVAKSFKKNNVNDSSFKIVFNSYAEFLKKEEGNCLELYLDLKGFLKDLVELQKNENLSNKKGT